MKLYRTPSGILAEQHEDFYSINSASWDDLVVREDLLDFVTRQCEQGRRLSGVAPEDLLPPIGGQEVWAAGVTYFRSRDARMEESKTAGGGDFYDRVYGAGLPELFLKATEDGVVGVGRKVAIRKDASWWVREPELVLKISPGGKTPGFRVGNDMSSRDIGGENPLSLPQAK